ncbi:MAG: GvpL/GvpF family gas vesicle protein [Thermodesulfobacteriota bacterium]
MESETVDTRRKTKDTRQETQNRDTSKSLKSLDVERGTTSTISGLEFHIYLYCFFKGPSSLSPQKGIDGANDTTEVSYRDLRALVSPVPSDEYNEDTLNRRISDLEWLTPKVKRHEEIVRYAMGFHPVIPIRFGTIYATEERLLQVLRSGCDEFSSHLDFINGKEEWGIKVYAGEGAGRKMAEASSEAIGQLDERISSAASSGQAYLLRKKRENLTREQSIGFLSVLSDRIFQQLLSQCVYARRNKLLSKDATGIEGDMILNAAFLLDKLDVEAFKEEVDALAASYESDALYFEISGPWPCYNFCPDFEALT